MAQAALLYSKIPTENPQLSRAEARQRPRGGVRQRRSGPGSGRVTGNAREATRGDGRVVVEAAGGITVYPARRAGDRWRASWYEGGRRRQCESVTEEGLAAKLARVGERLAADAPHTERPGADLIAYYLSPSRQPADRPWSRKHADTQRRLCSRYLAPDPLGTDHDTAAFAVDSVRRWWNGAGRVAYPAARRLLISADAGGSNGYRTRAWKSELAALALETGLAVTVCHFPPGTSKWNRIEHLLFSHITMNWRGRPLTSHEVIVSTIAATTTATGLTVHAELDPGSYPEAVKISDEQMACLPLDRHDRHGDWNYTLRPEPPTPAPPAAPPAREPERAAWAHPALTGLPASG